MSEIPGNLYPFESHWLDLKGLKLHYLDEGPQDKSRDKPVVLMLHGNPTWSFYYRDLVLQLRDQYRCIVPDHIGCGLSDKPDDSEYSYTLEQRVADLQQLIDHLDIQQPINLVAHDWGGMIGFAWARHQVERINRLVVLNTAAFPMPADKKLPFALWLGRNTKLGAGLIRGFNAFSGIASRIAFKKPVSQAIRKGYTAPYDCWKNRIATLRFVQDIPLKAGDQGYDIILETEKSLVEYKDHPVLIGWGEKDFVFDHPFLDTWIKHLPQAEVMRFADCGHYVLEDAGVTLRNRIQEFLLP